jgi:hypothetical protein
VRVFFVTQLTSAVTVEGSPVKISVSKAGGVGVDNAKVVAADVPASNGVIHIIDSVSKRHVPVRTGPDHRSFCTSSAMNTLASPIPPRANDPRPPGR